jgi:predicted Zn-dependent protease
MATQCLVDNFLQIPALAMLFLSALALGASAEEKSAGRWPASVLACGLALALLGPVPEAVCQRLSRAADQTDDAGRRLDLLLSKETLFPADCGFREDAARAALELEPPDRRTAVAQLISARSLNPTNALYPQMLGQIAADQGRFSEAGADARLALSLEPNYLQARLLLILALKRQGRSQDARAELDQFRRLRDLTAASKRPKGGYALVLSQYDGRLYAQLDRD